MRKAKPCQRLCRQLYTSMTAKPIIKWGNIRAYEMEDLAKLQPVSTRRQNQRGVAMVETAFILPAYLMFCWGFLMFSWILFGYCNATYAGKMAARYAAFHGNTSAHPAASSDLKTIASQLLWAAPASGVTVTSTWPYGENIGNIVNVNITIVYPTAIPFSGISSVKIGTSANEVILE